MRSRRVVALLGTASMIALALPMQSSIAAPRCAGRTATIVGASGAESIVGTRRADVIVAPGTADTTIEGRGGDDRICSGAGSDIVLGGAGDDIMNGGSGVDALLGGRNNDRFAGGTGIDLAAFLDSPYGVDVDLANGTANGRGRDSLVGIEGIIGSHYGDALYGDSGLNVFFPGVGNDWVAGGEGNDFVLYTLAQAGVNIDLNGGTATGGAGNDQLRTIENAVGSPFDDVMAGTDGPNYLSGEEGTDEIDGRGGQNICYAESVSNCIDVLPTSTDPGTEPTGPAVSAAKSLTITSTDSQSPPEGAPRVTASEARSLDSSSAEFIGQLTCPELTGSAWLTYPTFAGYGRWAWRTSYPWPVGAWNYGPWLYNGSAGWQAYWEGSWYYVGNSATFPGGHSTFIEAWWYHQASDTWYEVPGECRTSSWHLIPGMYVVPR